MLATKLFREVCPASLCRLRQQLRRITNLGKLLSRRPTIRADDTNRRELLLAYPSDADPIKLVKVCGYDPKEPEAVEKGSAPVLRFGEHPRVEREEREFTANAVAHRGRLMQVGQAQRCRRSDQV